MSANAIIRAAIAADDDTNNKSDLPMTHFLRTDDGLVSERFIVRIVEKEDACWVRYSEPDPSAYGIFRTAKASAEDVRAFLASCGTSRAEQ